MNKLEVPAVISSRVRTLLLCVMWIGVVVCIPACTSNSVENELSDAFERYLIVVTDAQIHLDTSQLAEVAVEPRLESLVAGIEARREFTAIVSEEHRLVWVRVIQQSEVEATIQVKVDYRGFSQDFVTGKRTYGPTSRWYSRIWEAEMVKVDGAWKVRELTFIDWSG